MARVTVEDCIRIVNNPFDLVILAAKRARDVASGASITVTRDNDKNPVVALREIAQQTISSTNLNESVIRGMQRSHFIDDQDDQDEMDGENLEVDVPQALTHYVDEDDDEEIADIADEETEED